MKIPLNAIALKALLVGLTITSAVFPQSLPLAQDSYVATSGATTGTNFGSAVTLNVGGTGAWQSLVQFDLSTLPPGTTGANISKATLLVFVHTLGTVGTVNVSVANGSWTEFGVTGLNTPVAGAAVASGVSVSQANTYMVVDATAAVQNWLNGSTNSGFLISPSGGGVSIQLDSKESTTTSHPAELLISLSAQGAQGPTGATGPQGIQGLVGATGAQGTQGLAGATGAQGIQGLVGATGAQGTQGLVGATGAQGIQGLVGATGAQGTQGLAGATGAQGTQGLAGATGAQGTQGLAGATGAQGTQGLVGATGAQGTQGLAGATGAQGTQGLAGATGAQGTQGLAGATGAQGTQGLVGATGAQGTQGLVGATGAQGTQGLAGATGAQGTQGLAGATGAQGTQGPAGATGAQGFQGTQGPAGATGAQGAATVFAGNMIAPAIGTFFMTPNGSGSGAGTNDTVYGSSFIAMPAACSVQALQVNTLAKSGTSTTTSLTITLYKNGSPTSLACTQTTSASTTVATQCQDTAVGHYVSLQAGDTISLQATQVSSTPIYFIGYSLQCK